VAFFRTVGGSVGVAALGTALGHQVAQSVTSGLRGIGVTPLSAEDAGAIPDLSTLPEPLRAVFMSAFSEATGHVFLLAAPFALVALVCIVAIREVPLRTTIERVDEITQREPARPVRLPEPARA
jgi:hypothetical protein